MASSKIQWTGFPVDARGLHRDQGDAWFGKPVRKQQQLGGRRAELAHLLPPPAGGIGHPGTRHHGVTVSRCTSKKVHRSTTTSILVNPFPGPAKTKAPDRMGGSS